MDRLSLLRDQVIKAKQAYYFGGSPIMTDAEYDALEDQLREISPNDPALAVGAPVPPDHILEKAEHRIHMGSQDKVNTEEEFLAWYAKVTTTQSPHKGDLYTIHVSLKGDGGSAAAYYEDGYLTQVISRGDGVTGEDITANAVKFKGLPTYVQTNDGPFSGAVRFEVILRIEDWKKIRPDHDTDNCVDSTGTPVNPRNIGNGIMGRKDGVECEHLSIYAFDVEWGDKYFHSEYEKALWLKGHGFQVIPGSVCATPTEVIEWYNQINEQREQLHKKQFWIDGIVLKMNNIAAQRTLGITHGKPKGQRAWKFEAESAETTLLSVELTAGHTGAIIPNGRLEPVQLGGTTVQNVLLNNWEEIERLGLKVGARVKVIKANDIIPKIIQVIDTPEGCEDIPEPTECPWCGGEVGRSVNSDGSVGAITMCKNDECPMKTTGKIKRWVKSLDILGIGDSVLTAMVEDLGISSPADLYSLDRDALAAIIINKDKDIKLGDSRADGILEQINSKRELTLPQFLGSLGVRYLGKRRVEIMCTDGDGELDSLEDWTGDKLLDPAIQEKAKVPGMGESIHSGIQSMREVIDGLLSNGVTLITIDTTSAQESPSGGTICITGTLPSGKKKKEYADPISNAGFKLVDKVSKDLNFLVVSDLQAPASSKRQKAEKYGVTIIDESQLLEMI